MGVLMQKIICVCVGILMARTLCAVSKVRTCCPGFDSGAYLNDFHRSHTLEEEESFFI